MIFLLIAFILSFLLTWLYRKYAIKKSILDHPNKRSSHALPVPKAGGIAVAITWFIGITYMFNENNIEKNLYYALLAGIPLSITGFIDDIINIKPSIRLLIQFIVSGVGLYFLGGIKNCQLPIVNCQFFFSLIAFLAIIWSTNLFNFLDGIDGYISIEVIFISLSAYLLTSETINLLLTSILLGFLFWNWPKAKIFIGDVGSTFLGYTVAIFAIYYQNNLKIPIITFLILTSVFWFDATITLIRRIINKEKLSEAHRKHAYQRIVRAGFSHRKTVLYSLLINLFGLGLAYLSIYYIKISYLFLLLDLIFLTLILLWIDKVMPFEYNAKKIVK